MTLRSVSSSSTTKIVLDLRILTKGLQQRLQLSRQCAKPAAIVRHRTSRTAPLGSHVDRLKTSVDANLEVELAALRKQLDEVRAREQDLQDFFDNASLGLHSVGPDGVILWVNQAELDMLGYTRDEYVGRPISDFHADAPTIEDILHRLKGRETLRNYEARLRCKDGSIRHVLISS